VLSATSASDRVYPLVFPLGVTLPVLTYQRVSTQRVRVHEGTSLVGALYQVTCWDNTPAGARALAREVVGALEDMTTEAGRALVQNQLEGFAPEQKLHRVIVDVRLWVGLEEEVATS